MCGGCMAACWITATTRITARTDVPGGRRTAAVAPLARRRACAARTGRNLCAGPPLEAARFASRPAATSVDDSQRLASASTGGGGEGERGGLEDPALRGKGGGAAGRAKRRP